MAEPLLGDFVPVLVRRRLRAADHRALHRRQTLRRARILRPLFQHRTEIRQRAAAAFAEASGFQFALAVDVQRLDFVCPVEPIRFRRTMANRRAIQCPP